MCWYKSFFGIQLVYIYTTIYRADGICFGIWQKMTDFDWYTTGIWLHGICIATFFFAVSLQQKIRSKIDQVMINHLFHWIHWILLNLMVPGGGPILRSIYKKICSSLTDGCLSTHLHFFQSTFELWQFGLFQNLGSLTQDLMNKLSYDSTSTPWFGKWATYWLWGPRCHFVVM